jgi:hypothetical protein
MDSRIGKRGKLQALLMAAAIVAGAGAVVFSTPAVSSAAKIDGEQCLGDAYKRDGKWHCRGKVREITGSTCEGANCYGVRGASGSTTGEQQGAGGNAPASAGRGWNVKENKGN